MPPPHRALALTVVLAASTAALLAQPPAMVDRSALLADDALRVLFCGTANPLPSPGRAKSCTAIIAGGRIYLVDVGEGSWLNLSGWGLPADRIDGVFLTHFHSDHITSLGEINMNSWAIGRTARLRVFGPAGVERVVAGFTEAYALDTEYRVAHHGAAMFDATLALMEARGFTLPEPDGDGVRMVEVLREGDLLVRAFAVDHEPIRPAVGYRFDYRGRSVAISGDTARHEPLAVAARDVDVLVHEAQANHLVRMAQATVEQAGRSRLAKILGDIPDYHTTPEEAADLANRAGARLLVLSHLGPSPGSPQMEAMFLRGVEAVRAQGVDLANDGMLVTLPFAESGEDRVIEVSTLDGRG